MLRELYQSLFNSLDLTGSKIIQGIEIGTDSDQAQARAWLSETFGEVPPGNYPYGHYDTPHYVSPNGNSFGLGTVTSIWSGDRPTSLYNAAGMFVRYLDAENRTGMVHSQSSYDLQTARPSGPVQLMYARRDLEEIASSYMLRAFNVPMTVNRYRGSVISLHVGKTEIPEGIAPPSPDYLAQLFALPELPGQGDGIKAFMGIVLLVIFDRYRILIIDEPEAFLHPPQAYLLGKVLAELQGQGTQVIVATHSADLLKGITSSSASDGAVGIVRLTRSDSTSHIAQVEPPQVRDLYSDPLIRHYPIIDGLFYRGAVLCEGDSDCTYFRAVFEDISSDADPVVPTSLGLHLTHCSGKSRIHVALTALRSAGVPTACIVDLDMLREDRDFNRLVTAAGGDPAPLEPLRNTVLSAINAKTQTVEKDLAKYYIDKVFSERKGNTLTNSDLNKIRDAIDVPSGWKIAKQTGRSGFSGAVVDAFDKLDNELKKMGIFLIVQGVLERFHPEVPQNDKAGWLSEVLESGKYRTTEASKMLREVAMYVRDAQ
ncbi:hypothetical protein GCM10009662_82550 [Catellatospora coxensis]|uniref:Uncharacterized protein n=2 Tax=Catellatospora coxensis TaxID=310354 RepID=A0A8J3PBM4_9ACTN|nr:hypothetical protein Cco03nite_77570 [Catellatospora coxensis]